MNALRLSVPVDPAILASLPMDNPRFVEALECAVADLLSYCVGALREDDLNEMTEAFVETLTLAFDNTEPLPL